MVRILIVEDEKNIVDLLEEEMHALGYETKVATDGEMAIQCFRPGEFDVVLLDVGLPKKDGYKVARTISQKDPKVLIVMVTARTAHSDQIRGLMDGAIRYVCKPFEAEVLGKEIKGLVDRLNPTGQKDSGKESTGSQTIYRFGDVEVDLDGRTLKRAGKKIQITKREFDLLKVFIQNPGKAFGRETLLDKVWRDAAVVDRNVDTVVRQLRKKIEPDPHNPTYIQTLTGHGYIFEYEEKD